MLTSYTPGTASTNLAHMATKMPNEHARMTATSALVTAGDALSRRPIFAREMGQMDGKAGWMDEGWEALAKENAVVLFHGMDLKGPTRNNG